MDGFQYTNGNLDFFPTAEGYVKVLSGLGTSAYKYVFNYVDHLGNIRLSYAQDPRNSNELAILEENHYYPYGLKHNGYNGNHSAIEITTSGVVTLTPVNPFLGDTYKYKFGGKEYDDTFNINTYDFGARNYNPALGRWMNLDPLAEKMRRHSPYNYAFDNPIFFIDADGMAAGGYANINPVTSTGSMEVIGGYDVNTVDKDGNILKTEYHADINDADKAASAIDATIDHDAAGSGSNKTGNPIKDLFNKLFSYTANFDENSPLIIEDNLVETITEIANNPSDEMLLKAAQAAAISGSTWFVNKNIAAILGTASTFIPSPKSQVVMQFEIREVKKWIGSVTYNLISGTILSVDQRDIIIERQATLKSITSKMPLTKGTITETFNKNAGSSSPLPIVGNKIK